MSERVTITRLENAVQRYAWGSRTAIPELLGLGDCANGPVAELWIGAHPLAPSKLVLDERRVRLDEAIDRDPEAILGARVAERFGRKLPFLFKVLAAAEPLSVQCHPDAARAREGFERENRAGIPLDAPTRSFRDPNAKPELIVALNRFHALRGFRSPEQIARLTSRLRSETLRGLLAELASSPPAMSLESLFRDLMSLPEEYRRGIAREAERSVLAIDDCPGEDRLAYDWVAELYAKYPGDVGVLSPLLLNLVVLEPGEGLYLDAGTLHAYLRGVGVEIMGSSDNVLRGGLTTKHVDVPELLRTTVFEPSPATPLHAGAAGPCERVYETPAAEFRLSVLEPHERVDFEHGATGTVEVLLVVEGSVDVRAEDGSRLVLRRGQSALVPASAGALRVEGRGKVYRATVP